jgi:TRAP-type C4-dicarboxylate transport system permease small subunit
MKKIIDAYHRLLTGLLVACVALLLVPVCLQMLSRFTDLIPPYIWTEELSRFLLIWMIMIGAMIGVREGTHFDVDVWPSLSGRANALLRMVSQCFVLIFALVFVIWGVEFVRFGWNQTSELADLPMTWIFIAWPLTGLTWLVFLGETFRTNLNIFLYKDVA